MQYNLPAHPIYPTGDLIASDLRAALVASRREALNLSRSERRDDRPNARAILAERQLEQLKKRIERIIILLEGRY